MYAPLHNSFTVEFKVSLFFLGARGPPPESLLLYPVSKLQKLKSAKKRQEKNADKMMQIKGEKKMQNNA